MPKRLRAKGLRDFGRCYERLEVKTGGITRLVYTGLSGELEHLKIKTRLKDEMFESVMGECEI